MKGAWELFQSIWSWLLIVNCHKFQDCVDLDFISQGLTDEISYTKILAEIFCCSLMIVYFETACLVSKQARRIYFQLEFCLPCVIHKNWGNLKARWTVLMHFSGLKYFLPHISRHSCHFFVPLNHLVDRNRNKELWFLKSDISEEFISFQVKFLLFVDKKHFLSLGWILKQNNLNKIVCKTANFVKFNYLP